MRHTLSAADDMPKGRGNTSVSLPVFPLRYQSSVSDRDVCLPPVCAAFRGRQQTRDKRCGPPLCPVRPTKRCAFFSLCDKTPSFGLAIKRSFAVDRGSSKGGQWLAAMWLAPVFDGLSQPSKTGASRLAAMGFEPAFATNNKLLYCCVPHGMAEC